MFDTATVLWLTGLTLTVGAIGWALSGAVAVCVLVGLLWATVGAWADYRSDT